MKLYRDVDGDYCLSPVVVHPIGRTAFWLAVATAIIGICC